MDIRVSEIIDVAKLFFTQEDIIRNAMYAVVIAALYLTYLVFICIRCKVKCKNLITIIYILIGLCIIVSTTLFIAPTDGIIATIIMYLILVIKMALA